MVQSIKSRDNPLKQIAKQRLFKLLGIDTRQTFLLAQPLLESNLKTLLTVTTFTFAGSLTFLGLRHQLHDTVFLQWSWVFLGLSVLVHLFVQIALLDALMAHGRVETDNARATELLKANGLKEFSLEALSSFYNDGKFRKSANILLYLLVSQNIIVMTGCILMSMFVLANL